MSRKRHDCTARPPDEVAEPTTRFAEPQSELAPQEEPAPLVDDDEADPTLIGWMLDRSPEQRLEALQGFVDSIWELRNGSKT
jgi:hypothetical protein